MLRTRNRVVEGDPKKDGNDSEAKRGIVVTFNTLILLPSDRKAGTMDP